MVRSCRTILMELQAVCWGGSFAVELVDPAKRRFQIASNSPVFVDSSGNAKIDHKIASISRKYRSFL